MIRLAICLTSTAALLTGCAGPIETRVETASSSDQTKYTSYVFVPEPDQRSQIYDATKTELRGALTAKGFEQQTSAPLLVDFALANRPASIGISAGENESTVVISQPKKRKLLQSCKDQEHRLIITIVHRNSGAQIYRGTASEYHCNAALEETLPFLIKEALADLGQAGDGKIRQKIMRRAGLE